MTDGVTFTRTDELPKVGTGTPGHFDLELLGPHADAAGGPVLVAAHCAECCCDPECARCWIDGRVER
jgi:hypothetical protein